MKDAPMKLSNPKAAVLIALIGLCVSSTVSAAGTAIFTDGFESGDFSAWTLTMIDETAPSIAVVSPASVVFDDATPPFVIGLDDSGSGVDPLSFRLLIDGVDQTATCVVTASGADCVPPPLAAGAHALRVELADRAGNAVVDERPFDLLFGPGPHTLVRPVVADSFISELDMGFAGGDAVALEVGSDDVHRTLVRADSVPVALVAGFNLGRAELILTVDANPGGWGAGTDVDLLPLVLVGWSEADATWACPEAFTGVCDAPWEGGAFDGLTDSVLHTDALAGEIVFDVLADVAAFQRGQENLGWLLKKADEVAPGAISYVSREGGGGPRLELVFSAPPAPGDDADPPVIVFTEPRVPIFLDVTSYTAVIGYEDVGSGVDLGSLLVALDGVDTTDQCRVEAGFATCMFRASIADGTAQQLTLVAQIADTNGNLATAELEIGLLFGDVDTGPPVLSILGPADGSLINTPTVVVQGTASDDGGVARLSIAGVPTPVAADGTFIAVVALVAGDNLIQLVLRDLAGKITVGQRTVTYDPTLPALDIVAPPPGLVTNAATVRVVGTVFDLNGITGVEVAGQAVAVIDGLFQADVPIVEGLNSIIVRAVDGAGNLVQRTVEVTRFALPDVAITTPGDFTLAGATVTVEGTVSPATSTVMVEGLPASVAGGTFVAVGVPLESGINLITATATGADGHVATATVSLLRDTAPPRLTVVTPQDGARVFESPIAVSGRVGDFDVLAVGAPPLTVTVNGLPAMVAQGGFEIVGIDLVAGDNPLSVVATDPAGNTTQRDITVRLVAPAERRLRIVSGDRQSAEIGSPVASPLVVQALDAFGLTVANVPVLFRLSSDGSLDGGRRLLAVLTNAAGEAATGLTVGTRAGLASQRVEASAVGFGAPRTFTASATVGAPAMIVVDAGYEQVGVAGQRLPQLLVASVVDAGFNRLAGIDVAFTVVAGDGELDSLLEGGVTQATVTTDADGNAAIGFVLGSLVGPAQHVVEATLPAGPAAPFASFTATARTAGDPALTAISGLVLDNADQPVPGTTLEIAGTVLTVQAAADGSFRLDGVAPGMVTLLADGSTASRPGVWPDLAFQVHAIPGVDNDLGRPIHLLPLDLGNAVSVDETTGATLTMSEVPGFALEIAAGSVTFPSGATSGMVSATIVHSDKIPMVPNFGQQPRFIVTIQPAGARFDPPARLTLPNVDGLAPGATTEMYSFDHDLFRFVSIGTGVVSDDGLRIVSVDGVGVVEAGWHCGSNPSGSGTPHNCPTCKKCVNNRCAPDDGDTPPQTAPDDCKKQVCRGGSVADEPDTSEMPMQTPGDCLMAECTAMNGGSPRDVADTGDPPGGMMCCGTNGSTMTPDIYDPMTQCCTPSPQEVFAKNPMPEDWETKCPGRVAHPGHVPGANGCGAAGGISAPDDPNPGCGGFVGPCDTHDRCYDTCRENRGGCDGAFGAGMRQVCMTTCSNGLARRFCLGNAGRYESAVRRFGGGAYSAAQQNACDCCS